LRDYGGGLTLDPGALIALERPGTQQARAVTAMIAERLARGCDVTLPTVVLSEWWRHAPNRGWPRYSPLHGVTVEPLQEHLAKLAGWALGEVGRGPSVADAIVVASAAPRGDVVLTADIEDLERLAALFPRSVRLSRV